MTEQPNSKRATHVGPSVKLFFHQMAISAVLPNGHTYTFDPAGRPIRFSVGTRNFVRGLDGTIKEKGWNRQLGEFGRLIRTLDEKQSALLINTLRADLKRYSRHPAQLQASDEARRGGFTSPGKILRLLLRWDSSKLRHDVQTFKKTFKPLNILPPDQYFSVVIQVAEGCPWNKCAFCHFYKGRKFRIKSLNEIRSHIRSVTKFLGQGIHLRKSVFLSDANALAIPTAHLLSILAEVRRRLPDQTGPDGGIYLFGDLPAILEKSTRELSLLKRAGLVRVYVGLESGADIIRTKLNKPLKQVDAVLALKKLKTADLKAGVIVLLDKFKTDENRAHVTETAKVLNAIRFSKGDFIYFSPLVAQGGEEPRHLHHDQKQFEALMKLLRLKKGGPVAALYDIREFVI